MDTTAVLSPCSEPFQAALLQRERDGQLRSLKSACPLGAVEMSLDNKRLVNFASNDYLGLSQHPALKERSIEFIEKYGAGAPASRLLSGNLDCYESIENKLAKLKGKEAALIFATGFQANSTILSALAGKNDLIAADRMNHRSLLDGMQSSGAKWFRYKHNDVADLRAKIHSSSTPNPQSARWIVTESIFSMDGDVVRLDELLEAARESSASLYVDEAHATGVCGKNGMGYTAFVDPVAVSMGTFGKGLGCFGAYIACSKIMRDYLINFCAGLIYSTALPPAVLGAIDAALDLVPSMESERLRLADLSAFLRSRTHHLGFNTGNSTSQIIPLIVGEEANAIALAAFLEDHGIFAPAIRPPTVPTGKSIVRLSLSAHHTDAHIEKLVTTLGKWHGRSA